MTWLSTSSKPPDHRPWWVIDDFFPNLLTGFRVAEYNGLLGHFPGLRIASTYGGFDEAHAQYAARYPRFAERVLRLDPAALAGSHLAYVNFLNNAHAYLPHLQAHRVPFVMTLYPGGGFGLYEPASDAKLTEVLASPLLREVIVTQPVTRDYLRARAPAALAVTEIFGVVSHPLYFDAPQASPRRRFGVHKNSFDVAFVAEKYMPRGLNKGFPAFVRGVQAAIAGAPDVDWRIHVVGGFDRDDWRAELRPGGADLGERVVLHGRLETGELRQWFGGIDLVVSPNLPGALHRGNFDGFPTGCCVEAALCGTAFAATDPLGLSEGRFRDGEHYWHLEPGAAAVTAALLALAAQPQRLAALGLAGQARAQDLFSPQRQIGGRIAVLERQSASAGERA